MGRASETFGRWRDPWFGDPVTGMWNVEPLDEESGDPSTENAGVLGNEIATAEDMTDGWPPVWGPETRELRECDPETCEPETRGPWDEGLGTWLWDLRTQDDWTRN